MQNALRQEEEDDDDNDDERAAAQAAADALIGVAADRRVVVLHGRDGSMNPVPVLVLARAPSGNAVGLVSAVVWT